MSIKDPIKSPNSIFGAPLIGACLAVICSVLVSSSIASMFGNTYNSRLFVYLGLLLWSVIGAIIVFVKTYRKPSKGISFKYIILWFLSSWLWPLLLIASKIKENK